MVIPKGGIVNLSNLATQPASVWHSLQHVTAQNLKAGYVSSASSARSACQLKYEIDRFLIKKGQKRTQKPDEQTDSVASGVDEGNKSEDKNQQEDIGEGTGRETAGVSKKLKIRSIQDEHRKFQEKWTDKFLFVLHGMNPLCLICKQTCAGFKRSISLSLGHNTNLYEEMHICKGDLACCHKSGSPFDFAMPMWLL